MIKNIVISLLILMLWNCSKKEMKIDYNKVMNEKLVHKMFEQMKSSGNNIFREKDSSYQLKNQLKKGNKLFFRFNISACGMCIDSVLLNLNKFSKRYKLKDDIVILTAYQNNRDINIFKKVNDIQFDIINIKAGKLNLHADKEEKPYLFVSDSTLLSKSFFIPEKSWSFLTKKYLNHVKETYFTNKQQVKKQLN